MARPGIKLVKGAPRIIVFISESVNPMHNCNILIGMSQYTHMHTNYTVRFIEFGDIDKENMFDSCDGIVILTVKKPILDKVAGLGVPVVNLCGNSDSKAPDARIVGVLKNDRKIGTIAAEWFLRRGFKNFAYCGVHDFEITDPAEETFSKAVAKAGFRCDIYDEKALTGATSLEDHVQNLFNGLKVWIPTLPPRTAVLCMHDRRASLFMSVCRQVGRSIPDDIAVMGANNDITLCSCAPVPITSIDTNPQRIGYAAMRILATAIERPCATKLRRDFQINPRSVVERDSTKTYPVDPPWLADVLLLLDENIDKPIQLENLAEAAGVSQSTLQVAIHKTFGMSANKYILSVKMRKAKHLVETGRYSVKEIAAKTGLSTSYFTRTYRAHFGCPPSAGRVD